MDFYRATTSKPPEIRFRGFAPKDPQHRHPSHGVKYLRGLLENETPWDLATRIVGHPDSKHLSTGTKPGCCGFSHKGTVYTISIKNLKPRPWTDKVLGIDGYVLKKGNHEGEEPELLLNSATLRTSSIIGIAHKTADEITFFTPIQSKYIMTWRATGSTKAWAPMSKVKPLSKAQFDNPSLQKASSTKQKNIFEEMIRKNKEKQNNKYKYKSKH